MAASTSAPSPSEQLHDLGAIGGRGEHQRASGRCAVLLGVDIRAGVEQRLHRVDVARGGGEHQRRRAGAVACLHVGAGR